MGDGRSLFPIVLKKPNFIRAHAGPKSLPVHVRIEIKNFVPTARDVALASGQQNRSLRGLKGPQKMLRVGLAGSGHCVGSAWAMRGQPQKPHIAHKKLLWINRLQRKTGRVGNVGNFFCGPSALRDCVGDCVGISPHI